MVAEELHVDMLNSEGLSALWGLAIGGEHVLDGWMLVVFVDAALDVCRSDRLGFASILSAPRFAFVTLPIIAGRGGINSRCAAGPKLDKMER